MSHMSQRLLPHRPAPEASDWRVQTACGGHWSKAKTLLSGAAPPRTSGATSGCSVTPYEG